MVEKVYDFFMSLISTYNYIGHKSKFKFYPSDSTKRVAASDFGWVVYLPKIISYPQDPTTYVPFAIHYIYEPKKKDQKHCNLKQG